MSELKKQIEAFVDSLPPNNEWWKRDSRKVYIEQALKLSKLGLSIKDIEDILSSLYEATAAEYGD